jgi:hypothetical protein
MENLARAIEGDLGDEDEIIVTGEHEGLYRVLTSE